jgi:DNA modification methylase
MEINTQQIDEGKGFDPKALSWGEELKFPSSRTLSEYGNRVYNRYPARSIFIVPRTILSFYKDKGLNILDPFMGSGTTAVETVISGNNPYGVEIDPLARMVSEVSSTIYSAKEFAEIQKVYENVSHNWNTFKQGKLPNLKGIERWFHEEDLIELLQLKNAIDTLVPKKYYKFFLTVYADCIKPVSLMERQSLKPYISKRYEKITKSVNDSFVYSFESQCEALFSMSTLSEKAQPITWLGHDATNFKVEPESIDIAITSPPYINAYDYTRCTKVENSMCGFIDNDGASKLRKLQVGHESRRNQDINESVYRHFSKYFDLISVVDPNRAKTCLGYFNDMRKNLKCVYKALKDNGEYYMIIGDNSIRKIEVPTHEIIANIANDLGFKWIGYFKYEIKDQRTSIPRNNKPKKMRFEHVLIFRK